MINGAEMFFKLNYVIYKLTQKATVKRPRIIDQRKKQT